MITATELRNSSTSDGVLDLLRTLGYPVSPVEVNRDEWRRGGVELPWNGEATLSLVVRLERFDLFLLDGVVPHDSVHRFLREYRRYNIATKSAVVRRQPGESRISLFDLDTRDRLRRLDVDLESASPHALDRVNLLACPADETLLPRIFDRALDREVLTRQFFERFREAVGAVAMALGTACPREAPQQCASEALLIMSRLLFLQFVQKRGWLDGERRFLVDRVAAAVRGRKSPYATVLAPLFFECLNTPRDRRRAAARRLGNVPYLNGGLFEPSAFELRNDRFDLPAELVESVLEDVFERFDFSLAEGDTSGAHIDPEMLGKVFESLMESSERLASGSYYTPRPIVEELVRDGISEWLSGSDHGLKERLAAAFCGDVPQVDADRAAVLVRRLESITVLDPACGSGAFLLAALVAIESLHRGLATAAGLQVPRDLRRRIVERSLFGVDLKAEAVRLCELRLWLAIVSASSEASDQVQPLPNLDRNVMQGDSLLGPTDHLGGARADVYAAWISSLRAQRDLVSRYRNAARDERPALARLLRTEDLRIARELLERSIELDERALGEALRPRMTLFGEHVPTDPLRAPRLQERIRHARQALARAEDGELGFFAYDVHFAHVLAGGGFAVVAGNPPWIRNSRIDAGAKQMYVDRYSLFRHAAGPGFHQPDVAVAFVERALMLCQDAGVLAMLVPAKLANAGYATALREHVTSTKTLVSLHDWSGEGKRWFEADTFPLTMVIRNSRPEAGQRTRIGADEERFEVAQASITGERSVWRLIPREVSAIADTLALIYPPLSIALGRRPLMGVKTGNNRAFFLGPGAIENGVLVTADGLHVPLHSVARCVRGRDLRKWSAAHSEWMLWPPAGGWSDLPQWAAELAACRGVAADELKLAFVRPEHVGVQVAWKDLSRGMCAAVLPGAADVNGVLVPVVPNQTLYTLEADSVDEAWAIAAVLNSTVAGALLLTVAERAKDDHYRYFGRTVASLPFPIERWCDMRRELVSASRAAQQGCDPSVVDDLVASLYGLSGNDLELLRGFVARRLRRDAR